MAKIRTIDDCGTIILDDQEFKSDENGSALNKLHDHLLSDAVRPEVILKAGVPLPEYRPYNKESTKDFVSGKFTAKRGKDGSWKVTDTKTGEPASRQNAKRILKKLADQFDYTFGEKAAPKEGTSFGDVWFENEKQWKQWAVENTENPAELAAIYRSEEPVGVPLSTEERMIADYGGIKTTLESFGMFGDMNRLTDEMKKAYIPTGKETQRAVGLDGYAEELSEYYGWDITPQDLVDFMERFPKGMEQAHEMVDTDISRQAEDKFKKLTGLDLNDYTAQKAIDAEFEKIQHINETLLKDSYATEQELTEAYWDSQIEPTEGEGAPDTSKQPVGEEGVSKEGTPGKVGPPKPPDYLGEPEPEGMIPVTGIRNSIVNAERYPRGLQDVVKEGRKRFAETWNEAMHNVKTGLVDPRSFVELLDRKWRKMEINDLTAAYLLMDRIDLTNQKMEALDRWRKSQTLANDMVERVAYGELAVLEDKLQQNDEVSTKVGTVLGRGLSARRMLAQYDFTLASMKREIASFYEDKSGHAEVPQHIVDRLREIEEEHSNAMKQLSDYQEKWKYWQAHERFKGERKEATRKEKGAPSARLSEKLSDAAKRIRTSAEFDDFLRSASGDQPQKMGVDLPRLKEISASILEDAAKASKAIEDVIDYIKEAVNKLTDDVDKGKLISALTDIAKKSELASNVVRERQVNKISELAKNSNAETITKDMISPLRKLINDYAKTTDDFDKVLDDVHSQLKDNFTNLSKEDIRDAYSGYGDVRLDTKKGLLQKLNELKKEQRLVAKIRDIDLGKIPKKGVRKGKGPESEKIKALQKEYEEKMKAAGFSWDNPPKTPEEKNARALESLKNRLQKEIENLTAAIEGRKDVSSRTGKKIELDDHAREMMNQRDALKEQLKDIEEASKPPKTNEERLSEAKEKINKRIDQVRKEIHDKQRKAVEENKPLQKDQELTRLEDDLKSLTELRDQYLPKEEKWKDEKQQKQAEKRLNDEISKLNDQINAGERAPSKEKAPDTEHIKKLKEIRDAKKDLLDKIAPKPKKEVTYEQRVARAEKALEKQIEKLSGDIDKIKAKEFKPAVKGKQPRSITLDLLRGRRDALNELKRKLLVDTDKDSSESAVALEKYKDMMRNRILEYSRKIDDGEFEPVENKKSFENDAEAHALELQVKRAETSFRQEKVKAMKANRNRTQKWLDAVNAWKRFSVLTGIPSIGKIGFAVIHRTVGTPIEEISGTFLRMIPGISNVARQAPRHGAGFSWGAEGQALMEWAKAENWKDAMQVMKTGQGMLDEMFGKYVAAEPELLGIMGRIHGALKNTAKRAEFARSYHQRMKFAMDRGADPGDRLTQLTAMSAAYLDGNRAIFMQDNFIVKLFNDTVGRLEETKKVTPELAAGILRFMLPIVKIPTNFVGESLQYGFGSLKLLEVFGRALTGHLNDMKPEEADSLMRSLKKGTVGALALGMGFAMPGLAGGYYMRGAAKKSDDEADYDQIMIAGFKIPKWAVHFPIFEAMQLGATMRNVMEKDEEKGRSTLATIGDGLLSSSEGLIEQAPLFNTPEDFIRAVQYGTTDKLAYNELGSLIPLGVQNIAQYTDVEGGGLGGFLPFGQAKYIKRAPDKDAGAMERIIQEAEMRIPGLRQKVPEK